MKKKISQKLLDEIKEALKSIHFGSVEIYVQNGNYDQDVFFVTGINGATQLIVNPSSYTFEAGNPVSPVILARFADDTFPPVYMTAQRTALQLNFTEVRS